jgi:hypothetical protein
MRRYVSHTARIEGDFVVFLIGLHIAKPWRIGQILRVAGAMRAMTLELRAHPELGFLGEEGWPGRTTIQVQYWRSHAHLDGYARSKTNQHLPAWSHFNKVVAATTAVGIWHETYLVREGEYETVYGNMPPFGLAKVSERVEAVGRLRTASGRLGLSDGGDSPV